MACRLLVRYGRLLCRSTSHALPVRLHAPVPVSTELLSSSSLPCVSARLMCTRSASEEKSDVLQSFTSLDKKIHKLTQPEDVLQAWVEHKGNGDQAATVFIKWTRLVLSEKASGKDVVVDHRLNDIMDVAIKQISTVWNYNLVILLQSLLALSTPHTVRFLSCVQNEVLWRIRRLSIKQLGLLVNVGHHQKGNQGTAIVKSALKQLELRWMEISDTKTVSILFSRGNYFSPMMMDKLEDKALELIEGFSGEEIRKMCVSLAALGRRSVPLLRALSYSLLKRPTSELTTTLITDIAYAYAKLNFHQNQVLQLLASELLARVSKLSSLDVTRFSKSISFLKWIHTPLLEAFTEHFVVNSEEYSTLQLCNLIMTFARLGFQPSNEREFFTKVHARLEEGLSGLGHFLQTDMMWSLCVLQQAQPHYLLPFTQPAHISALSGGCHPHIESYWLKLLHIAATLDLEHPDPARLPISHSLAALLMPSSVSAVTPLQTSLRTALERLVSQRPKAIRIGVETVYGWTIDGEMVVDCDNKPVDLTLIKAPHLSAGGGDQCLPEGARRLAFVAWDFSTFNPKSKELLGRPAMMKRHLQLAGFLVIEIPYDEWQELKTAWKENSYLKDKIGKVVAEDMAR